MIATKTLVLLPQTIVVCHSTLPITKISMWTPIHLLKKKQKLKEESLYSRY